MLALLLASSLVLQLDEARFQQAVSRSGFIEFMPPPKPTGGTLEVVSTDGFPVPLRGRCWSVAGGYGLSSVFASIAGVIVSVSTSKGGTSDRGAGALAMGIGALVGVIPGALLGNESRREEMGLARGVVTLLDVGGSIALGFTLNQVFTSRPFF